jgi:hypothetical protein
MTDKDGVVGTSCDCRYTAGINCIHNLLIERYHTEFEESVLEGEESAAFLLYSNYKGLLYLFSAATASDSARHHSHKRTIVTCDLDGKWRCKSCSRALYSHYMKVILTFRNCHHIDASKEISNLCLIFRTSLFQYQKPLMLLRDLVRQLLFGDVSLTSSFRRLPDADFRPIRFSLQNLFKAFQTFSCSIIHLAALAAMPIMKPRLLSRLAHTSYTPLPRRYNLR